MACNDFFCMDGPINAEVYVRAVSPTQWQKEIGTGVGFGGGQGWFIDFSFTGGDPEVPVLGEQPQMQIVIATYITQQAFTGYFRQTACRNFGNDPKHINGFYPSGCFAYGQYLNGNQWLNMQFVGADVGPTLGDPALDGMGSLAANQARAVWSAEQFIAVMVCGSPFH